MKYFSLKIFGSLAILKPQEKKRSGYVQKLESRGIEAVLVGFERDYSYRLYVPSLSKVLIARDVVFDETKTMTDFSNEVFSGLDDYLDDLSLNQTGTSICDDREGVALLIDEEEPSTYREALTGPESGEWKESMQSEYDSLIKNGTWTLVDLPVTLQEAPCK